MSLQIANARVWRREAIVFRWGWAAVTRSRDGRTVRNGIAVTRRGAERIVKNITAERERTEGLLWDTRP